MLCMSGGYLQCNTVVYIIKILTPVCAEYHCLFVRRNIQWLLRFEFSFKKIVEHVGHVIVGLSM